MLFWQASEAVHNDFVQWIRDDFYPSMVNSPEVIRQGIFKLKHASVFQNGEVEIKNPEHMYQYMGMWEVSSAYR